MRTKIRIGGVSEHYNVAWKLAIESGTFDAADVEVEWVDVPGGTGDIVRMLASGELDMATALTEGAVAAVCNGEPIRVHSVWVSAPLTWGIHVPAKTTTFTTVESLKDARIAISRAGSGSELMARVLAEDHDWSWAKTPVDAPESPFRVVGGLDGALEALPGGEADLFLWCLTMTAHLSKSLRCIGQLKTPWPSFVVACSNKALARLGTSLMDRIVLVALTVANSFVADRRGAAPRIADRLGISLASVHEWLDEVSFGHSCARPDSNMITDVAARMHRLGRAARMLPPAAIVAPRSSPDFRNDLREFEALPGAAKLAIAGIELLTLTSHPGSTAPVKVVFLLHGRRLSAKDVFALAQTLCASAGEAPLMVVIVEHRNHGRRMISSFHNASRNALQMFSIMRGTARDVCELIDLLPAVLDRDVLSFGVCGVSLGGHCALIAAGMDARLSVCISLLGCGDFARLIARRLANSDADVDERAVLGERLFALIAQEGALANAAKVRGRVLLAGCSGDRLVPPALNERFKQALSPNVAVEEWIMDHAEHAVEKEMQDKAAEFLNRHE